MKARLLVTKVRKCGKRKERSVYCVGGDGGSREGVLALFTTLNPPIPYQVKTHRVPRIVNGIALLEHQPIEKWWAGSSKDTEQKKSADEWAIDTFGMTVTKRLSTGECVGCKDPDEALAILVSTIKSADVHRYVRQLTIDKINELPRVTPQYELLIQQLSNHSRTKTVSSLMAAQATIWRIAYNIPPSKRSLYIRNLAQILASFNLKKDAVSLMKTFI